MPRKKPQTIFDKEDKQLEHYVNGINKDAGMHPGILSKCPICHPIADDNGEEFVEEEGYMPGYGHRWMP